jgi:hypothetical protein
MLVTGASMLVTGCAITHHWNKKRFQVFRWRRIQISAIKKVQITNTKQITMTEIQNSKQLAFDLI